MIKIFLIFFKRYPSRTFFIGVLFLIENLMEGLGLSMVIPVFEKMFQGESPALVSKYLTLFFQYIGVNESLEATLFLVVLVFVLKSLMMLASKHLVSTFASQFLSSLQLETFENILGAKVPYFQGNKTSTFVNSLTNEAQRAAVTFIFTAQWLSFGMSLLLYATMAYLVAGWVAFAAAIAGVTILSPLKLITLRNEKFGQNLTSYSESLSSQLIEVFDGFKIIKAFANEDNVIKKFSDTIENYRQNWQKVYFHSNSLNIYSQPLVVILLCLILFMAQKQGLGFGQVVLFLVAFQRMLPAFTQMMSVHNNIVMTMPGYEVIQRTATQALLEKEESGEIRLLPESKKISFKDVRFSYAHHLPNVLNALSIDFEAGKTTALVGESGAGKTTIVDLILSFYEPQEGMIEIGNVPLCNINKNTFRSSISYVTQEPILFNGTIRENILWANPTANNEDLQEALSLSAASDFVFELEDELDTNVGDKGNKLSGGQRQRIALARALIRNPDVLILDEATSALDYRSENLITKSIELLRSKREITIIVIAHRLDTIKSADKIIVLDSGMVKDEGTWMELSNKKGSYINEAISDTSSGGIV